MAARDSCTHSNAGSKTCSFRAWCICRRLALVARKTKTIDQIRAMQDKAVRFLRDVVGDPDKAEEFEAMSLEEYAEHKRVTIENPFSSRLQTPQRRSRGRRSTIWMERGRTIMKAR